MDMQDLVRQHYGDADLGDRILDGLREAGVDTDQLTVEDLAATRPVARRIPAGDPLSARTTRTR